MLTKVEVRNVAGSLLTLPLTDISGGFVIRDVSGLDPVKATLVSSSFAELDGAQYQSSRREPRNLTFELGLEPDYVDISVRDLRKRLYTFFMPKTLVGLRFFDDSGLIVDIQGRVESLETDLFVQDPKADISLICFDPDFVETFSETIVENTVYNSDEIAIEYEGTVETGIELQLNVDRELDAFTIYHRAPDGVIRTLDFSADLVENDVLTISTIVGNKFVSLLRDSTQSSLLYAMSPQSNWIELQPGVNYIRVYAVGEPIPYSLTYTTKHGGL